jgi:hypothetical protein
MRLRLQNAELLKFVLFSVRLDQTSHYWGDISCSAELGVGYGKRLGGSPASGAAARFSLRQ